MSPVLLGPVPPTSDEYVVRELDALVLHHLDRQELVNITGGRQTGKTSLLLRLRIALEKQGAASAYVDCSPMGERETTQASWYSAIGEAINASLLPASIRSSAPTPPTGPKELTSYLVELARSAAPRRPVTIILDEITAVPGDLQREFFTEIRALFSSRHDPGGPSDAAHVLFVFGGSFDPERLVLDTDNSPFNVAQTLSTSDYDFGLDATRQIAESAGSRADPDAIVDLTGGHPYLTNRIVVLTQILDLDEAARQLFTRNDPNLAHLARKLRSDPEALELACAIHRGEAVPFAPAIHQTLASLAVLGLVRSTATGMTELRSAIYGQVLNGMCGGRATPPGLEATDNELLPASSRAEPPENFLPFMPDGALKTHCNLLVGLAQELATSHPVVAAICGGSALEAAILVALEGRTDCASLGARLNAEIAAGRVDGTLKLASPGAPLSEWKFAQMIEGARVAGLISKPASQVLHAVREWRNLVHPAKLRTDHPSGVSAEVGEAAVACAMLLLDEISRTLGSGDAAP